MGAYVAGVCGKASFAILGSFLFLLSFKPCVLASLICSLEMFCEIVLERLKDYVQDLTRCFHGSFSFPQSQDCTPIIAISELLFKSNLEVA